MRRTNFRTLIILLLMISSFLNTSLASSFLQNTTSSNMDTKNSESNFMNVKSIDDNSSDFSNILILENGTWFKNNDISYEETKFFKVEDLSLNSTNYIIEVKELNPNLMDVGFFVKFGSPPSATNYDYKLQTNNPTEILIIDTPKKCEYGELYITIICKYGFGAFDIKFSFNYDDDGNFRNASLINNPLSSSSNVSINGNLSSMDTNDFYKILLYSGQKINFLINSTNSLSIFLYDDKYNLIAYKENEIELNIAYTVSCFENKYYYLQINNDEISSNKYSGVIFDISDDFNNYYNYADYLYTNPYSGFMDQNDINDYFYFYADSGECVNIQFTILESLSFPHYDIFIYSENGLLIDEFLISKTNGADLEIVFCCPEILTSEIIPFNSNKLYIRIWNAANHYDQEDVSSSYLISIIKSWNNIDDRMLTAPNFIMWSNDSLPKEGQFEDSNDINDWFEITLKFGYTVLISVNISIDNYNLLGGHLVDKDGNIVFSDTTTNISISYTAQYDGNYYFRLFKKCFPNDLLSSYQFDYKWYIYTYSNDKNNYFEYADSIDQNSTIISYVSTNDLDDYFVFEIPTGSQINISGSNSNNLDIYLYDSNYNEINYTNANPWVIVHQNKKVTNEIFYLLINNIDIYIKVDYLFNITFIKLDLDNDSYINDAKLISINYCEPIYRTELIGNTDVNDYFKMQAQVGDKIEITVICDFDLYVSIIAFDDCLIEKILNSTSTRIGNTIKLSCYPNSFPDSNFHYIRIGSIDNNEVFDYNLKMEISRYDIEDGYQFYANEIQTDNSVKISSTLNEVDMNDWYKYNIPSGCEIIVKFSSSSDYLPNVDVLVVINNEQEIYSNIVYSEFEYNNIESLFKPIYFQIVNKFGGRIQYNIAIELNYLDDDNNGAISTSQEIPVGFNIINSLSEIDLNDFYMIEIKSGYCLDIYYDLFHSDELLITCMLWDEENNLLNSVTSNEGFMNYTNFNLDNKIYYLHFYNYYKLETTYYLDQINYMFNISLTNNDVDGDICKANRINKGYSYVKDQLIANYSCSNFIDINDFYKLDMDNCQNISIEISALNNTQSVIGIYLYDLNLDLITKSINISSFTFQYECNSTSDLFLRIYNVGLSKGSYILQINITSAGTIEIGNLFYYILGMNSTSLAVIIVIIIIKRKKQVEN